MPIAITIIVKAITSTKLNLHKYQSIYFSSRMDRLEHRIDQRLDKLEKPMDRDLR
jgi:hypothetical protein